MNSRLMAGAMSGTSADGVDIAIVRIEGHALGMSARLVHHHHQPYDAALRQLIFQIRGSGAGALRDLGRCGREISLAYAGAVNDALAAAGFDATDLAGIAAHGQTLFHEPPDTIQWLDPALLAARTGCQVISDFRRADCAAGGQGAPLVPFADFILFRDPQKNRVLLNIGGIANLTWIPACAGIDSMLAFDVGPGNCISDELMRRHDPSGAGYDANGELAAAGAVCDELVEAMFSATVFFSMTPPKSTDTPAMLGSYQIARDAVIGHSRSVSLRDELATACAITCRAIADVLARLKCDELIVSGGGTKNRAILGGLQAMCQRQRITTLRRSDDLGVPSQAKEAMAFAILGAATLDGVPSNVPSCTGAKRPVILGSITPQPQDGV